MFLSLEQKQISLFYFFIQLLWIFSNLLEFSPNFLRIFSGQWPKKTREFQFWPKRTGTVSVVSWESLRKLPTVWLRARASLDFLSPELFVSLSLCSSYDWAWETNLGYLSLRMFRALPLGLLAAVNFEARQAFLKMLASLFLALYSMSLYLGPGFQAWTQTRHSSSLFKLSPNLFVLWGGFKLLQRKKISWVLFLQNSTSQSLGNRRDNFFAIKL